MTVLADTADIEKFGEELCLDATDWTEIMNQMKLAHDASTGDRRDYLAGLCARLEAWADDWNDEVEAA
jgi:hypothetical protein